MIVLLGTEMTRRHRKKGRNIYSAEVNGRTVIDFTRDSISPQVFLKLI